LPTDLPRIAITMGDPAGVGPEVCLKLLAEPGIGEVCTPIVFGDFGVFCRVAEHCRLPLPERVVTPDHWREACREIDAPAVLDLGMIDAAGVQPGVVDAVTGAESYHYIEAAIVAALAGEVDAVTTGPINKEALRWAGIPYPGHTEIFAARTKADRSCMMLTCDELTCSFVTTHVGYRDVPALLNVERIVDVIVLTHDALRRLHGREPRLAICGLNPHGGEHGLFGDREEERLIAPAAEVARSLGITIDGPLPPDTAFLRERRRETDGYICMYHDQGHILLKALAFDTAVNVTLGLPIIRTSVDHGTALSLAGTGKARAESLSAAVDLAGALARRAAGR
jgi:4-hydroxythreonine-4-phosphate dehydrogenase